MRTRLPLDPRAAYWIAIRAWAILEKSDGCTGVRDFYVEACWEHDFHYRYARTYFKEPITRVEADARLRDVIQARSKFGKYSPMSWARWAGVRLLAGHAWETHRREESYG